MATQGERRAQTRRALLDAAAELFASGGVDGASIDAVAEAAGRTSGAVYDHFGGKEGLLFALLEGWVDDVAAVIGAELATATTLGERMAALWRNVSDPVAGAAAGSPSSTSCGPTPPATSPPPGRPLLVAWAGVRRGGRRLGRRRPEVGGVGAAVIGTLLGLEMMRRVEPAAVTDTVAAAALCGVVTGVAERSGASGTTSNDTDEV